MKEDLCAWLKYSMVVILMEMNNLKYCDKCGDIYDISPFHNMLGNGEIAYSRIKVYGNDYDLCPQCTNKLYKFIKSDMEKNNEKKNKKNKICN